MLTQATVKKYYMVKALVKLYIDIIINRPIMTIKVFIIDKQAIYAYNIVGSVGHTLYVRIKNFYLL